MIWSRDIDLRIVNIDVTAEVRYVDGLAPEGRELHGKRPRRKVPQWDWKKIHSPEGRRTAEWL